MREYDPMKALTFLADQTRMPNVAAVGKKMLEFPDDTWVRRSAVLAYDLNAHGFGYDVLLSVILLHQVSVNGVIDPYEIDIDIEIRIAVTRLMEQAIYGYGSLDAKYIRQNHLACLAYIADKYAVMELDRPEQGHAWKKSYVPNLKNSVQEMADYLNPWLPEYRALVGYMTKKIS